MPRPSSGQFSPSSLPPNLPSPNRPAGFSTPVDGSDGSDERVDDLRDVKFHDDSDLCPRGPVSAQISSRRRRPRHSGGFLLEPSIPSAIASEALPQLRSRHDAPKENGGALARLQSTLNNLQSTPTQHSSAKDGIQSSLLSANVPDTTVASHGEFEGLGFTSHGHVGVSPLFMMDRTIDGSTHVDRLNGHGLKPDPNSTNVVGNDPAQIVSLALSLSESRRKTSRTSTTGNLANSRRSVSDALATRMPNSAGGSLRHYLQAQRRSSWNPQPHEHRRSSAHQKFVDAQNLSPHHSSSPTQHVDITADVTYTFSQATLARAEMARTTLELSAEYRRLLQYLPPLSSQPIRTGGVVKAGSPCLTGAGRPPSQQTSTTSALNIYERQFNPLQAIRDRKTRARKKMTIDADGDGWTDITKVRTWVDQVAGLADQPPCQALGRDRLPTFASLIDVEDKVTSSSSTTPRRPPSSIERSKGSQSFWEISPAELFADAFWLDKDEHKQLIEDQHGNLVLAPSAVREDTPHTRQQDQRSVQSTPPGISDEETARGKRAGDGSGGQAESDEGHQKSACLHERPDPKSIQKQREQMADARFLSRLGRRRDLSHSASSSASSVSYDGLPRGRTGRRHEPMRSAEAIDTTLLEIRMNKIQEDEASKLGVGCHPPILSTHRADEVGAKVRPPQWTSPSGWRNERTKSVAATSAPIVASHRTSASLDHGRPPHRSSVDGIDSTAPNSPDFYYATDASGTVRDFVPSIAIDLSPPISRNASPTRTATSKTVSKLSRLRPDRSRERETITQISPANAFAGEQPRRPAATVAEDQSDRGLARRRTSSPARNTKPRRTSATFSPADTSEARKQRMDKLERDVESSRLRSFLKGGRLGNIVKSEVARVGDFFWKGEHRGIAASQSSPASSANTENPGGLLDDSESPARPSTSRGRPVSTDDDLESTRISTGNTPKFQTNDLLVFTPTPRGPFSLSPTVSPETSSIAARQRQSGLSTFDPLASQELKRPNASSDRAPLGPSLISTREFFIRPALSRVGTSTSRRPSDVSFVSRVDRISSADSRLKEILGLPRALGSQSLPVTGLSAVDILARSSTTTTTGTTTTAGGRPSQKVTRQWSITDRTGITVSKASATRYEIARVRALLLTSGVKAQEIVRRAGITEPIPSSLLARRPEREIPSVTRSQHALVAARLHLREIDAATRIHNIASGDFLDTRVGKLHRQINKSKEYVLHDISPMAQLAADEADSLMTELATTHTLAVKQLNDRLIAMLRRRRRRLRWIRRSGYVLLEWTLLGMMWWVWMIVVAIRLVRGVLSGGFKAFRWLFFL